MKQRLSLFTIAPLALAVASATHVMAQDSETMQLEEVLVTAQKREQSLQEVAISVTVMSGEKIVQQGFNDLQEMSDFIPGLNVEQGDVTGTNLAIRGINNGGPNVALEQAVAVFNDGVYTGRSMQSVAGVYDVSRMEVLFGPQPVYFGQSAIAGLVSYSSQRPTDELDGYVVAEAGSDDFKKFEGAISGPITDGWAYRAAGKYTESDGWTEVFATGDDGNASEDTAFRLSLSGEITENFTMYLKGETFEQETSGAPFPTITCEPDLGAQIPIDLNGMPPPDIRSPVSICQRLPEDLVNYGYSRFVNKGGSISAREIPVPTAAGNLDLTGIDLASNDALGLDVEGDNYLAEFKWYPSSDLTITSLTGYSEYDSSTVEDFDSSPYAAIMIINAEEYEMLSQELRIESNYDSSVNWMAGVYYQDQELDYVNRIVAGLRTQFGPPGSYVSGDFGEDATYWGAFGTVTFDVTDRLTIDAGLRWSDVDKSAYLMESDSSLIFADDGSVTGYSDVDDTMLRANGRCLGDTPTNLDCEQTIINSAGQAVLDAMGGNTDLEFEDDNVDYQLNVLYQFNDEITGFARYVTGYKAGGFSRGGSSFRVSTKGAYDSEEAASFEVGARFDYGNWRANATVYHTSYDDRQVEAGFVDNITDPVTGVTTSTRSLIFINAAEATVQGFEADLTYLASFGTTFNAGMAYIDSEYDNYDNAGCLSIEAGNPLLALPTFPGGPPGTPLPASPDCVNQNIDLSGTSFDGVPEWNIVLGISHTFAITDGMSLDVGVDASIFDDFEDERGQPAEFSRPFREQDGFTLLNARIALVSNEGTWEIAAYGRNMLDEAYWTNQPVGENPFGTTTASYSRPESYGLQLRYNL